MKILSNVGVWLMVLAGLLASRVCAQATFGPVAQSLSLSASCGVSYNENRVSALAGSFNPTLSTTNSYGFFYAQLSSNLTSELMTGSLTFATKNCGGAQGHVRFQFTVPYAQRWRLVWQAGGSGGSFNAAANLRWNNGAESISGTFNDSIQLLLPGVTYDYDFAISLENQGSGGGSFTFTKLAPETSEQLTYQGELLEAGIPFTGTADVQFTLFDAATGGTQVGVPMVVSGVSVDAGRFTATFSPPIGSFDALSLHAQVAVRTGGGAFVALTGRQPLTAAPYAYRSAVASLADAATNAQHAAQADVATTATSANTAASAAHATQADQALLADVATVANAVPFAGITSNPWVRSGSLLSTTLQVGIGKVPTEALDVLGNVRVNDQNIYLRAGTDTNHGLGWYGSGKPFATFTPDGPVLFGYSGGLLGTKQGGDRVALSWNSSGQVGVGTTNTGGFTFAVNGTAAKPGGGSWSVLSDPRTKTDVVPMTGTLDRLMQLHGYEYTYKSEFVAAGFALPGRQLGLMATEVEQVFPDWIERGSDGYMRVTERSTTALMVEALRDLRAEKNQHLAELRERVSRLEALVKARSQETARKSGE